jgi:hypothetical protein
VIPEAVYETVLPREEFDARLRDAMVEMEGSEGEAIREYVSWFMRRYPTPLARLQYARRKYEEAVRTRGVGR